MRQFVINKLLAATLLRCHCPELTLATEASSECPRPAVRQQSRPAPVPKTWQHRQTGQRYPLPPVIGGRPVAFYLASPQVSPLAKALYTGRFQPSDTDSTSRLLALVTTDNAIIRPFYRWCLDFTIQLSDGALGEYPGPPALAYATKFPREFFAYMDKDTSGQRYKDWVAIIAYSGLHTYPQSLAEIKQDIALKMSKNCGGCGGALTRRIQQLAGDIVKAARPD